MPASEEIRRENAYWIKERAKWRRNYKALAGEITVYKDMVKLADTINLADMNPVQLRVALRALQEKARDMMIDRAFITYNLLITAYKWEDMTVENGG